jgi:hypothetical protein
MPLATSPKMIDVQLGFDAAGYPARLPFRREDDHEPPLADVRLHCLEACRSHFFRQLFGVNAVHAIFTAIRP